MQRTASKKSVSNGSARASAWTADTRSSMPASRIRCWFSAALNHRSAAHTCTPNSRARKIDCAARPQPRSSTRMPGFRSMTSVSHSASHSELAPPLALAITQSGLISRRAREQIGDAALVGGHVRLAHAMFPKLADQCVNAWASMADSSPYRQNRYPKSRPNAPFQPMTNADDARIQHVDQRRSRRQMAGGEQQRADHDGEPDVAGVNRALPPLQEPPRQPDQRRHYPPSQQQLLGDAAVEHPSHQGEVNCSCAAVTAAGARRRAMNSTTRRTGLP